MWFTVEWGRKAIIVSLSVLGADQLSKLWVSSQFSQSQSVKVIGDFMRITLIQNPHAIFGLQVKLPFIPLVILAVCAVCLFLWRSRATALSFILGGAVGNLIDRIRIKAVIDFIDLGVSKLRWPVFNIADSCITIGILWLIIKGLKAK
ncbi:MAG: signal peptidase II [bacterium]|nr:signal peptidase II [bacterium]